MTAIVVAMIVTLAIAVGTVGLVLVGIEGLGRRWAPRITGRIARVAESLSGER